VLFTALCLLAPSLRAERTFPQARSDLKADPAARFGTLPNGMHYVILPNHEPKGRVALRLLVESGSFMENDNQRGLAHFLEHMAFNGTTHYPPDTLIKFFQRMGMNFGGDTNAYTSFDQTVYMLDLPDAKPATLKEGFQVFADYAGGMLLTEKEIDAERGIILSEKRDRDNVAFRTFVNEAQFVYAGTRIPLRIPIGQADIIEHAARDRFVDLYDTWYRPERMTVIAVGDADPDLLQQKLTAAMSAVTDRAPARPEPDLGTLATFQGVRVKYYPEAEAPQTTVSLQTTTNCQPEADSAAKRRKDLVRSLALSMLNRRLAILAKQDGAGFSDAQASADEVFNFMHEASIEVNCKPDQWQNAVRVADQELRRALAFGFQPAELKEATANYRNGLEQAVKSASTRRSPDLAMQIVRSLTNREVFTTPAENLALLEPALDQVTPAECVAALREAWGDNGRYLLVSGNLKIEGDSEAAIMAAYAAAHEAAVTPPAKIADETFAYTDFGPAGTVTERREVKDLGITLVTFANGVRLNLKPTDFQANRISINVRIGTGQLTEPADEPGLSFTANNIFIAGGLGRHSADDLRRILAGKTVGVGFNVGEDAFNLSGGTNRDDELLEFQLIAAHITDPGYRPEAMRQFGKGMEQMYNSFAHTANGALSTEVPRLLAGGDPRFGLPAQDVLRQRTAAEVKAWLAPQLAKGAIEIGVVGDLDVDATIAAVARTLGALPVREARPALDDRRQISIPPPFTKHYTFDSEIPKGTVALFWPTADGRDVHRTRRLSLLGSVFTERLRVKVREEIGGAYSPSAGNSSSDTYHDYGFMRAFIQVDPAKAGPIGDVTVGLANQLATKGVTADELERAKLPVMTSLHESVRTNGYWLSAVVNRAQEKPEVLDWARSRTADFESITTQDLDRLAKEYLGADHAFRVTVLPEQK
jgi:zinc protease